MNTKYLLPSSGNDYKANLHCHSTLSDGQMTPLQLKEAYKKAGYSVVAFTDHNVFHHHKDLDDSEFLALAGYELDTAADIREFGYPKVCHLNAIARDPEAVRDIPRLEKYSHRHINQVIAKLRSDGFIVNYNHPCWSGEDAADFCALEGVTGFEVYNNVTQFFGLDGTADNEYSLWLKHGKRAWVLCTDDNHNIFDKTHGISDSFGGWVVFRAPALRYDLIIEALEKGWFYASTGPEIYELALDDGILTVDCSHVKAVVLRTPQIGASRQNILSNVDSITHASFDIRDVKGFARVELLDSRGKMAFANPIYLD
jgi:hypothetical protein